MLRIYEQGKKKKAPGTAAEIMKGSARPIYHSSVSATRDPKSVVTSNALAEIMGSDKGAGSLITWIRRSPGGELADDMCVLSVISVLCHEPRARVRNGERTRD